MEIDTVRFGTEYAKNKPKTLSGTIVKHNKGGTIHVKYDIDGKTSKSHWSHLRPVSASEDKIIKAKQEKKVRFSTPRQDVTYPFGQDDYYCPLEPCDSYQLHTNGYMALLDMVWTDELTDNQQEVLYFGPTTRFRKD